MVAMTVSDKPSGNFNFAGINKRLAIVKLLQNWVGFEFELAQFF